MSTGALVNELPTERLVVLPTGDPEEFEQLHGTLKSVGGRVLQSYGSRVLVVDVPAPAHEDFDSRILRVHAARMKEGLAAPALAAGEALGAEAFRKRQSPSFAAAKQQRVGAEHSWGESPPDFSADAVEDEAELQAGPGLELAASPPDTSPFLIGNVAVGLIIVEGPDANLQFSDAERVKVTAEVQDGLSWLALQEPLARVTWTFDVRIVRVNVQPDTSLPNTFEAKEALWRNPAMASLGFSPDFAGVLDYVTSLRANLGTDHAYVAFFTKYPLRHFAYASKPRLVMHYENDGWGPDNIAEVFTHETGHIFGCPDEYAESSCSCNARFGFLSEKNANCELCAPHPVPCLMARNVRSLCQFTRVHLGWRDSNGDGVLDPLDEH